MKADESVGGTGDLGALDADGDRLFLRCPRALGLIHDRFHPSTHDLCRRRSPLGFR